MPKYIVNGKTYNIPDDKVAGFESRYPNATVEYHTEDKTYQIPLSKRNGFLKRFPNASYNALVEQPATQTSGVSLVPTDGKLEQSPVAMSAQMPVGQTAEPSATVKAPEDILLSGQLRRARTKLDELQAKRNQRAIEVHDETTEFNKKNLNALGRLFVGGDIYVAKQQSDPEKNALDVAIRQTEELIKDLEEQQDRENGVDVGFWRGFGRVAGDVRSWDRGMSNAKDAITMLNADRLVDKNATEGERAAYNDMMEAIYNKEQAEQAYGGNASFWNRAGVMTGHMPSFMLDFAMTGGFKGLNMLSTGATKAATKALGKEVVDEMAKQGFKTYVKNNGAKGLGQYAADWTIKALGTTGDDLLVRAPLMTNTVQAGSTVADIVDRKLGGVTVNKDGTYDFSNDKTWGSAIWQGEANSIIENYSEMFGSHLDPVVTFGNLSKLANVIGAKRISAVLSKADAGALSGIMGQTHQLFNKMGVSDYFGEVTEEYYGQMWRTMLNLDDAYQQNPDGTRTNLLATGNFHGDIWGGMALSMGLMGAGKHTLTGAQYLSMKHGVNKADSRAAELLGKEVWEPLRQTIDQTTNDEIGSLAERIVSDPDFTNDELAAVFTYMERSLNMRGFNLGALAQKRGGEGNQNAQSMDEHYIDGYNINSPQEMTDAKNMYDMQRQRVADALGEEVLADIDRDPEAAIGKLGEDERTNRTVIEYLNAKMVYDGMNKRVADDADARMAESDALVDAHTHKKTGMVQGATMKDEDRKVYIVNGNVVPLQDGTGIDLDASDNSIIIRDAESGEPEQVSPEVLLNVDAALDPTAEKQAAREAIEAEVRANAERMQNGVVGFAPGDVYTVLGEDGSTHQVEIVQDNGDNTVTAKVDGEDVEAMAKEQIQNEVDAYNKQRVVLVAESAENAEAAKPNYELNAHITLQTPEGVVTGNINQAENDDNLIEVQVNKPFGGKKTVDMYTREELDNMVVEVADENGNVTWSKPAENAEAAANVQGAENTNTPTEDGAENVNTAPTSRIMRKKGDIDAEASFENGATAQEMADAYAQEYGDEEGLPLRIAQEQLAQIQEEREKTKDLNRKHGSLRKQEKFWAEVVDLLTPKEETVAEEGRQETVGTPVALQYLLEGGKGSIENAGYLFYVIQAAFPHIGAQLQEIRNSMPAEMLGMAPDAFVASNPSQLQEVRRLVEAAYGKAGTRILGQMLANSTGFYPREGKALDLEIENLKPVEGNEQTQEVTEKDSLLKKVKDWLSPENISWAEGKSLSESVEMFGNEVEPIAIIPPVLKKYFPELSNLYLYSGKAYLIDHAANHHPELSVEEYENIQKTLDEYDDIKDLSSNGVKKLAFIKMMEKGYAVVTELSEKDGKIMLHKTFFYKDVNGKRVPYKNKPSLFDKTSVDGSTTISPAEKTTAGRHRNISALDVSADKGTDKSVTAEGTQTEISENAQNATQSEQNESENEQNELEKAEKERIDALVPTIEDVADGTQTADEFVAGLFGNGIRITPESFRKDTGLGREEQRRLVGIIAGKEKGGLTVEQAAEAIVENYRAELAERGFSGDSMEMRDMVIGILSSGNPRAYAKEAAARRAEQALHREMEAFDRYTQEAFHMSAEEYIMYEESMLPKYIEQYKDFDEQEYYSNFADEQSTQNEHDTTRKSAETGGSREILSEEQPSATPGEGTAGEGQQGGTLQGDVQGNAQEGIARAEAGQEGELASTGRLNQIREKVSVKQKSTDKSWDEMSAQERMQFAENNPITIEEVESSSSDDVNKSNAVAYIRGTSNIITQLSYLKVYEDVRIRPTSAPSDNGVENRTQLAEADSNASAERGRGGERRTAPLRTSEEGGTDSERVSDGGARSEGEPDLLSGKSGDNPVRGPQSSVDGVSSRGENSGRSGTTRIKRSDGGRDGQSTSRRNSEVAGKQPSSIDEELNAALGDFKAVLSEFTRAGRDTLSISIAGLNNKQLEILPKLISAGTRVGYAFIKKGVTQLNAWAKEMKTLIGKPLSDAGLTDVEVDAFIEELWNAHFPIGEEVHTIGEWASILGMEKTRSAIKSTLKDKKALQDAAESIGVKIADADNIAETLPFLLPQQQEDVLKAETQFFDESHNDREHAFGKGYMFTNGTGTGKTYTGLGIVKRFIKQGKGRILIVTPSQQKVTDWIGDAKNLNIPLKSLDDFAKEQGTTATQTSGEGAVVTTFANFRENAALLEGVFDLVVYDESHRILENKQGAETAGARQHYMVTNRDANSAFMRLREINPKYKAYREAQDEYNSIREAEVKKAGSSKNIPSVHSALTEEYKHNYPKLYRAKEKLLNAEESWGKEEIRLKEQAEKDAKVTKVVFLSATPFNTRDNLDYAERYIFTYPEEDPNTVGSYKHQSPRTRFYLEHFGGSYKFRYGRLEKAGQDSDVIARQEIAFSDYLQNTLQTMSGRVIDSEYDYSRDFPTVSLAMGDRINDAISSITEDESLRPLWSARNKVWYDYNYSNALFETMKISAMAPRLKQHLDAGRKIVIFHRRVEAKYPLTPPFALMLAVAEKEMHASQNAEEKKGLREAIQKFRAENADLLEWEKTLNYSMPREQLAQMFGNDKVLFFSGKESAKVKNDNVSKFNDDNSGKNIIVIQEASGKEGISLHDRTGKHQRVVITLALPQSPITALQIEGRIYRIGNKSNAIFEYPILGLDSEMVLFGQNFNKSVSTTENLALGSQARNLRDSFARGIEERSGDIPVEEQGVGGKEADASKITEQTPYDNAILDYYTNQKITARRDQREGVDYYPTPEPLGFMMNEWGRVKEGDELLEPSAGHGAIARYAPTENKLTAIEPSGKLFSRLQIKAGGASGRNFVNDIFENHNIVNKHDVILMNPPFGVAGKLAAEHVEKAFKHLTEGGRIVAIVPEGKAQDRIGKWLDSQKDAVVVGEVLLPDVTFKQAGTNIKCRVVVIDKITNERKRLDAAARKVTHNLDYVETIEEFFNELQNVSMPDRTIDTQLIMQKRAKRYVGDLKDIKGVKEVVVNQDSVNVRTKGWRNFFIDWSNYSGNALKDYLARQYKDFANKIVFADENSREIMLECQSIICKLANMTEDEMERYVSNMGKGDTLYRISESAEEFAARQKEAVEKNGIVAPGLKEANVDIVDVERHDFSGSGNEAIRKAKEWANNNIVGEHTAKANTTDEFVYTIDEKSIKKYLSSVATGKSDNLGVHLSVLKRLPDVIDKSIEAEIHADYKKTDGRTTANGVEDKDLLIHRFYGCVRLNNELHRVKITLKERMSDGVKPYSYEVTKIESLSGSSQNGTSLSDALNNSIPAAKLLENVEKSYDKGVKLLDASEDLTYKTRKDATQRVVDMFETANTEDEFSTREGDGSYNDDEVSFENDPISKVLGKSRFTRKQRREFAERERQRMVARVESLAKKLNLDNVEIVTDASTLEGKKKRAKGFYSKRTGKITIVIPNHSSTFDVEQTLLHEAVAHYGLRQLFGEHFDTFLDNVFNNADEAIRQRIVALAAKNGWDFRTATEEYLAKLAESTYFEQAQKFGWWQEIKRAFLSMLRKIGFDYSGPELSDNELRYILWRSYENLADPGRYRSILGEAADMAKQYELGVGNYSNTNLKPNFAAEVDDDLYRDGDPEIHERRLARDRYEERVKSGMFQSQEALQDSMLGLKEAMQAILGKETYIEDVAGHENAYLGENRLSSVNKAEADAFARLLFKPMLDEVAKLARNEAERQKLTDYMMAKHGLERNMVMYQKNKQEAIDKWIDERTKQLVDGGMAQADARTQAQQDIALYPSMSDSELDKQYRRDYAGLTALTGMKKVAKAEAEAQRMVEDYQQAHDTAGLWKKVNAVSKAILQKSYECGMMSKETFDKLSDMYEFYIPLRGFDEKTSAEAYAYLTSKHSAFNAPIKKAEGRRSKADDPFAYLQSMAEGAIMQGNRNKLVKQRFLNFALNHPSDLVSVSELWVGYNKVTKEWEPVFPDNIESTDTPEEVERKMQDFEANMESLAQQHPDQYKRGKDAEKIPYRVVEKQNKREHQVVVKRGGRDYVITINGNPRAAQALNGQTNPDNDMSGAIGAILRAGEKINRQLSAFYTTRNPDFILSNFLRDLLYTNTMVWIKESPNYAWRFHRNFATIFITMKRLLAKYRKGELDMSNKTEAMFHQFMMNGGETGYTNIRDIEQHKNDIKRELKKSKGRIAIRRAWDFLAEQFDELNRTTENCARFAAFVTSREMGRSIDRAIYDAKEISVNFNKKGSGAKFYDSVGQTKAGNASALVSGLGRSGYVFWNAAIQGTTNFGRQMKRHPAKAFTGAAVMFLLGAIVPYLAGDDDEDDKNAYHNLPDYVRRSNILFRAGDNWISIPLPIEYRAMYGMGELMTSVLSGKEHLTDVELAEAILGQATQVLPIDFLEGGGGLNAFVPSAVKPFWEAYVAEKSWTGLPLYKDTPFNKDMPEWTKAYSSANKHIVNLAAALNEAAGGDPYTKGTIMGVPVDFNPAKLEYMLNGYFGGVSGTIDKLTKTAETIVGAREYDPRSILLVNRVVKAGDERTEYRAVNNEYSRLKEEHDRLRTRLRHYEEDTDNGIFDYAEKIDFLYNSPEYERYEIFEDYRKDIDYLYDELQDVVDDEERKQIEAELNELKKEMIQEMNTTRERKWLFLKRN